MPRVLNYKQTRSIPAGAVYIGRFNRNSGLPGSKWANPFTIGRDGTRAEVIAKYEAHLHASGLINQVHELRGCDLVCSCAPLRCHGDLLLRLANAAAPSMP